MYTVGVRDQMKLTHSLLGETFRPAHLTHATNYSVSLEIARDELGDDGLVFDVVVLRRELRGVLDEFENRGLDELQGNPRAAEAIARQLHRELGRRLPSMRGASLAVTLEQSTIAWARYAAALPMG
jgi:6-pyruvoyl-tetrahydropterin synthase